MVAHARRSGGVLSVDPARRRSCESGPYRGGWAHPGRAAYVVAVVWAMEKADYDLWMTILLAPVLSTLEHFQR